MKYHCDICGVNLGSQKWLDEHFNGKQHQSALAKREELKKLEAHSIFLAGFKHPITEGQIKQALESFGKIERVILDKKAGKFAILELSDVDVVAKLLELKHMTIGENKITIKKRKIDFGKQGKGSEKTPENAQSDMIKVIQGLRTDNIRDSLQRLFEHYRRDPAHIEGEFMPQLLTYMQSYFADQIDLMIFGSTETKLAFYDSDVDLCFVSKNPTGEASNGQPSSVNGTVDLMAQKITDLRSSKIHLSIFNSLPKPDRVKLLTRILNEFRKETHLITSLTAVPDARTPVIRFTYTGAVHNSSKLPIDFEISLNNFLGVHKGRFVRNALNEDLLLILFLFRLWARCFKMFGDSEEPKGHWSSYALSLIFVQFCQLQDYITEVQRTGTETIKGWAIGYKVMERPLKSCGLDELFLKFFKFLASEFNQKPVLSVRHGQVYKPDDFMNAFDDRVKEEFKLSLVNVQDPIELNHNVTQNVSEHYLKLLRSECMRVICNLKANPSDPIRALFAEKSAKPPPAVSSKDQPSSSMEVCENDDNEPAGKRVKIG